MAETLSPNPATVQKQRALMSARIQSPTSPFFLGSNDDQLERAQARAARAASIRRKSVAAHAPPPPDPDPCLGKEQILELFQNCIKLASENKINQKNTWELNLIDHLCEIIKVEEEDDAETNFQKVFRYKERRWDSKKMIDSGGMPSSHSATVTALALTIGLQDGTGGPAFAIAIVFACVVMYDASGVRQHAGRQAELLNQIVCEFPPEHPLSSSRPLRDSLGHTPIQVVAGGLLGCIVAYLLRGSN